MEPSGVIILVLLGVLLLGVIGVLIGLAYELWEWLNCLWQYWIKFIASRLSWIPLTLISCLLIYFGSDWGIRNSPWWWILAILSALFLAVFLPSYRYVHKTRTVIARCLLARKACRTVSGKASTWVDISENNRGGYTGTVHHSPGWSDTIEWTHAIFELPNGKELVLDLEDCSVPETKLGTWVLKYGRLEYNRSYYLSFSPYPDQEEGKAIFESKKRK